ncbi:MAG: ABC transporter permease [Bacteroidales bacterium]|nr:ABC transporter permease [Bacteroidales bacterium]
MNHNLKLAIRNLLRQRTGSLINIIGFSISLASCLVIILFVQYELSFDKYNKNYKSIYRLLKTRDGERMPNHPIVFFNALQNNIPELQKGTTVFFRGGSQEFVKVNNSNFFFNGIVFTTPKFFSIFSVDFIQGNSQNALPGANKVVLTESAARKMFGNVNPTGQLIKYLNKFDLEVTGIIKDIPKTSHFPVDMLVSAETQNSINKYMTESWNNSSTSFYYLLPASTNIPQLEQKIRAQYMTSRGLKEMKTVYQIQPLSEIHLYSSDTLWDSAIRGDIRVVKAFVIIAFFILCIACFNYINLSLALSGKSDFYTGIQKAMGADNKNIFASTITESLVLVAICSFLAVLATALVLPYFNQMMGASIQISLSKGGVCAVVVLLAFFAVLIPSSIQSWFRTRINPSTILSIKRNFQYSKATRGYSWISRSLTVLQLTISIVLISVVIIVYRQTTFVMDQQLGFNKSQLLEIKTPFDENTANRYRLLKEQLTQLPEVKDFGASWNSPAENINNYGYLEIEIKGKKTQVQFGQLPMDAGYLRVLEAGFILGKNLDPSLSSDSNKIIINKAGMDALGLNNPIGQKVKNLFWGNEVKSAEIAGVIENIQYESLQEITQPACFYLCQCEFPEVIVRLNPGNISQTLKKIEGAWNKIEPGIPFQYEFVKDKLQTNYKKDIRTKNVLACMALIAILISMLGVFGLAAFTAQGRIKEIGIRKVNGARLAEIMILLDKVFVKWVFIAFIIAMPIAIYAMNKWLENFAYKIGLQWWFFALAGFIVMVIALLTVSWQTWRVATRNPVEALNYE